MVDVSIIKTENVLQYGLSIISSIYPVFPNLSKAVLHQKYVEEGLSIRQIAAQMMSSKTTVREALIHFGIPLRATGGRLRTIPYGLKVQGGEIVPYVKEQKALVLMKKRREAGQSFGAIARELNTKGFRSKSGHGKWSSGSLRQFYRENVHQSED